jgi:hypothetical protein
MAGDLDAFVKGERRELATLDSRCCTVRPQLHLFETLSKQRLPDWRHTYRAGQLPLSRAGLRLGAQGSGGRSQKHSNFARWWKRTFDSVALN